jgi:hypothetical protein
MWDISIWVSSFEIEKHAAYTDTSLADIAEASLGFLEPKRQNARVSQRIARERERAGKK